jgi:hypothetical protein
MQICYGEDTVFLNRTDNDGRFIYSVVQSFILNNSSLDSSGWWEEVSIDGVVDLGPE